MVRFSGTASLQRDPALFDHLLLTSPLTGQQVPLSAFARVDAGHRGYFGIGHQGWFPAETLSFNLAPEVVLHMLPTIVGSFQRTAQAFRDSRASQLLPILATLASVNIVLGVLYESYIHPLTILATLPSAGVGALLAGLRLMLDHGIGSETRRPEGYATVGGSIVSQAMVLFTTLVIHLYLDRGHTCWLACRARRAAPATT